MNTCPVTQDIDRHLAEQDAADRLELAAWHIKQAYTKAEAKEIIDDHFGVTGGDDVTELLAGMAVARNAGKAGVVVEIGGQLRTLIDGILTAAAEKTAIERGA
jgi:hypothetical protein